MSARLLRTRSAACGVFLLLAALFVSPGYTEAQESELLEYPQTMLQGIVSAEFRRSLVDCNRICAARTGCAGFDYSSSANLCRLFQRIEGAQSDEASTAATRDRIPRYSDPLNVELWYYARFDGVDLWGGDLVPKGIAMYDAASCERACDAQANCKAFTYNSYRSRCFLKSYFEFVQNFDGGTSGVYIKRSTSASDVSLTADWELHLDSDIAGNDLGEVNARSYVQCLQECEQRPQCGGFTWTFYTRPDRCFLKQGADLDPVSTSAARRGMTSARKISSTVLPVFVRPVPSRD